MNAKLTETLHDTLGPYGEGVEALKEYVIKGSAARQEEGWSLTAIEYRKDYQHQTGRYRWVADVTYVRTTEPAWFQEEER